MNSMFAVGFVMSATGSKSSEKGQRAIANPPRARTGPDRREAACTLAVDVLYEVKEQSVVAVAVSTT
jgi:hypothetical protein